MAKALKTGPTHVALLRGVNLAGNKKIAMADLAKLIASLGFEDPKTLLQSGNVVFRCKGRTCHQIETQIETTLQKRLGLQSHLFVRTADEWRALIAANPFPKEAAAKAMGPGGYSLVPAHANHFVFTTAPTTILLYGTGPVEFKYVNPGDDPRNKK